MERFAEWQMSHETSKEWLKKSNRFSFFWLVMLGLTSLDDSIVSAHQPLPSGTLPPLSLSFSTIPTNFAFSARNVW